MQKKKIKILMCLILIAMFTVCIVNSVSALDSDFSFTQFDNNSNASLDTATQRVMGTIINTIKIVGTGTAIVIITYLGIKYMMAAPTEKAEFKKSAGIYILGAVLIFATTNILAMIIDFTNKNIST